MASERKLEITIDILGWILLIVLAVLIFKIISDTVETIVRVAIAVLVAAEIIYFARLWVYIPMLDRIDLSWIEMLNQAIVNLFQSVLKLFSNPSLEYFSSLFH